ncbi:MAG: nickel pincer cofactor biosynthesis protein LarB [Candidatus Omnitrophica bacterium]|nr:nickel pincer cofactor biosynthesis protein LarB [Candidatus Omnitrophota bacterium]MBU1868923.1 nickel pincer cofactor biosynthesis protein LarB [Candidatus Omnitrophota bacterium]
MALKAKYCELGFAKLDIDRKERRGFAEAIYCPGKDRGHLKEISRQMLKNKQDLLLTKLDRKKFAYLKKSFPKLKYNPRANFGYLLQKPERKKKGLVAVVCAGTSDIPVAEEAVATLEAMGNRVVKLYDVGVAGVHRVMGHVPVLQKACVVVVVAGMEGALASLVSGLVSCPVVAVPTSCGYGANFGGLAALLTMLNSCSPGVTVVNIDNGFGAGYFASLINEDK